MSTLYINLCFHLCLFSQDRYQKSVTALLQRKNYLMILIKITKLLLIGTIPTQYRQQYIK